MCCLEWLGRLKCLATGLDAKNASKPVARHFNLLNHSKQHMVVRESQRDWFEKRGIPRHINSVYLREDNAGCYHCASTLLSVHRVATKHEINLKRVPKRKRPMWPKGRHNKKSHENICQCWPWHRDSLANDDCYRVIWRNGWSQHDSEWSATYCKVSTSEVGRSQFINNIEYSNDGMQVWRAYGIYHGATFAKQVVALCLILRLR